ncbi:hypothetical protein HGRIS_012227 [Hohenbuehelia grisea]|uniref:F-box domain-containing protein n=1 Tax=Hohenbuehelia grisea TaxID=104357 RepID=A0ABR3IRL9_9AGAR
MFYSRPSMDGFDIPLAQSSPAGTNPQLSNAMAASGSQGSQRTVSDDSSERAMNTAREFAVGEGERNDDHLSTFDDGSFSHAMDAAANDRYATGPSRLSLVSADEPAPYSYVEDLPSRATPTSSILSLTSHNRLSVTSALPQDPPLLMEFPTSPFENSGGKGGSIVGMEGLRRIIILEFIGGILYPSYQGSLACPRPSPAPSTAPTVSNLPANTRPDIVGRPFDNLPLELLFGILRLCIASIPTIEDTWKTLFQDFPFSGQEHPSVRDLRAIASVSKQWNQAVRELDITYVLGVFDPVAIGKIKRSRLKVSIPATGGCDQRIRLPSKFDLSQSFVKRLVSLNIEKMIDLTDPQVTGPFLCHSAPNLESLSLTGARRPGVYDLNESIYPGYTGSGSGPQRVPYNLFKGDTPQLKYLILRNCLLDARSSLADKVTSLRLHWCGMQSDFDERLFITTLRRAENVEYLDIFCLQKTPKTWLSELRFGEVIQLSKLKHIRITDTHGLKFLRGVLQRLVAPSSTTFEVCFHAWNSKVREFLQGVDLAGELGDWKDRMAERETRGSDGTALIPA